MKKIYSSLLLLLLVLSTARAAEPFQGYTIASEGAWCWFADPRAINYKNASGTIDASYVGYIDVHGSVKATQFNNLTGERNEVLVRSGFQPDDHNNPTFLVLPDERILIIYSRHTDEPAFYYRVSVKPGDITMLGEEKCIKTNHNTTYPSPFILSDDPEHFYMCWRGLGWHPTIAKFSLPDANDDVKVEWGPYQMVQSTGARPYAKYYSNGKDKIYLTYTTGHPDNEQPNWVYFNVVNLNAKKDADGTVTTSPALEDIKGNQLSVIADGKFAVNKTDAYKSQYPYTIVDAPSNLRDWVWQVSADKEDNPVIAMVRINGGKSQHQYFYAKWTGSAWRLTDLADGGGRFHPSNTEYCYSGGEALDPEDPNIIYLSIPTVGASGKSVYEIWKYTLDDAGTVISKEQITRDSEKNNVRPYVLPGNADAKLRLTWMNGDYYYWMVKKEFPLGYPTAIHGEYNHVQTIASGVEKPFSRKDFAGKEMKAEDAETLETPSTDAFTLMLNLKVDATAYQGQIVGNGAWQYGMTEAAVPYIKIGEKTYNGSNKMYTSDNWAFNSNGTSGDSWPTPLGNYTLTLTYDGKVLTIYRNGVIDQRLEGVTMTAKDVKAGGYQGTLNRAVVYDFCLSQDEVKYVQTREVLDGLQVAQEVRTDLVLPQKVNGEQVTWTSSHADILNTNGTFQSPEVETEVLLTAIIQGQVREFPVKAMPRDITKNLLAAYEFEEADKYVQDGDTYVKDLSGNAYDLLLKGSAKADGVLNLKANAATAFSTNGYAIMPAGVMDGLRSYTVLFTATPSSLTANPRFYDWGFNSGNSLFLRANTLAAGIKYSGGATTMVNGSYTLSVGKSYKVAVTFDAKTCQTNIYIDGELVGSGMANINEAYMIAEQHRADRNYIGRTQWWDSGVANDNGDYVGTMDAFEVYNVALTDSEIKGRQGIRVEDESLNVDCGHHLLNRDFEGSYTIKSGTGVASDRAIYAPKSWSVSYSNGNENDMTILNSSCLYSSIFSSVKLSDDNGKNAYLVRHKWGTSTIALTQRCDTIPAGYYRFGADVWQSGSGGKATLAAAPAGKTKVSGTAPSGTGEWQKGQVVFSCNGTVRVTFTLDATHTANGEEMFVGFDNVTLYDVTANRSEAEIATLLSEMEVAVDKILDGTLTNESARDVLKKCNDEAKLLSETSAHGDLYAAFVALRDAMLLAQKENAVGVKAILTDAASRSSVYDLNGRLVRQSSTPEELKTLAPNIYVHGGKKVVVK